MSERRWHGGSLRIAAARAAGSCRMKRVVFCLIGLLLVPSLARADDGLQLYAAGSLTAAMTAMLSESGLPQDRIAAPVFGPPAGCASASRLGRPPTCWPRRTWARRGGWQPHAACR